MDAGLPPNEDVLIYRAAMLSQRFPELKNHFAEGGADTDGPEDYESMKFEREVENGQVGVGDGI